MAQDATSRYPKTEQMPPPLVCHRYLHLRLALSVRMAAIAKLPVYYDDCFNSWDGRKRAWVLQNILEAYGLLELVAPLTIDSSGDDKQLIYPITFNNSLLITRATRGHRLPSPLRASSQRELL